LLIAGLGDYRKRLLIGWILQKMQVAAHNEISKSQNHAIKNIALLISAAFAFTLFILQWLPTMAHVFSTGT